MKSISGLLALLAINIAIIAAVTYRTIAPGIELRILPLGDSITWGYVSPDGNGYCLALLEDLSSDNVVFAGVVENGNMTDNWMAGYTGWKISEIAGVANASLVQRPNIVLVHAGTNDMNYEAVTEPIDEVPQRLGFIIDQIIANCSDATIMVAQIINAADPRKENYTIIYNNAIPAIVQARAVAGFHVLTVDFRSVTAADLIDGIHPTGAGYIMMGNIWAAALATILAGWIQALVGLDPNRTQDAANGGPDELIPAPIFGISPVQVTNPEQVFKAAAGAAVGSKEACVGLPVWNPAGKIAPGVGENGAWKYIQNWASAGEITAGLSLNSLGARLADMDGDEKEDYL